MLTHLVSRVLPPRLPRAEAEDIVHAVFGTGPGWRRLGEWPLVVEFLALVGGVVAGALGSVAGAVVCFVIALASDAAASRSGSRLAAVLDLAGWGHGVRALLRWAVLVPAVGTYGLVGFPLAVVCAWVALALGTLWLQQGLPMLRYVPGGPQPTATLACARVFRRTAVQPPLIVIAELAAAVAVCWITVAWPVVVVAGVVVLGYGVWGLAAALGVVRARPKTEAALLDEIATAGPRVAVYVSAGIGQARNIVRQWEPVFAAFPEPPVMIVREASQLGELAPGPSIVVLAPQPAHVEALCATARVVFVLSNGPKNVDVWRVPGIAKVFLGHGDSDKATSVSPLARVYDEIWVAGPAAIERYRAAGINIPAERFVVIGRPQAERLPAGPSGNARPVVLYAPTFEGHAGSTDVSSLQTLGAPLVRRLLDGTRELAVWFRPHPSTGVQQTAIRAVREQVNAMVRAAGAPNRALDDEPEVDAITTLAGADVLITDVSSMANDFLHTGRPIIAMNPMGLAPDEFRDRYPAHGASYVVGPELDGLDAALDAALGADPLREARLALKKQVLGDPPNGSLQAFVNATARLTT